MESVCDAAFNMRNVSGRMVVSFSSVIFMFLCLTFDGLKCFAGEFIHGSSRVKGRNLLGTSNFRFLQ